MKSKEKTVTGKNRNYFPISQGVHSVILLPEEGCFGVVTKRNTHFTVVAFYRDGEYQEIYIDNEDFDDEVGM